MNSLEAFKAAQQKREELADQSRAMGIDEEFISLLVDTFYLKVQSEPDLGTVFSDRIGENWPVHLAKMKVFWESIALRTALYEGKPMRTHRGLEAARPEHFSIWLRLWEETLDEIAPSDEAKRYLIEKARSMGVRLAEGRFGKGIELD
ncbi:MAG: group III truncated hemoglobin [Fimbriimonadaceae bacterium]